MITGAQIRAARALLDWTSQDLATASGVSYATIQRAERADGMPNMQSKNLSNVRRALEQGGVLFVDADASGGAGVRLAR